MKRKLDSAHNPKLLVLAQGALKTCSEAHLCLLRGKLCKDCIQPPRWLEGRASQAQPTWRSKGGRERLKMRWKGGIPELREGKVDCAQAGMEQEVRLRPSSYVGSQAPSLGSLEEAQIWIDPLVLLHPYQGRGKTFPLPSSTTAEVPREWCQPSAQFRLCCPAVESVKSDNSDASTNT